MATIYIFNSDGSNDGLYISLESMNRVGYFPLTVAENGGFFKTTEFDDLSSATLRIAELLREHVGQSADEIGESMEEIAKFFNSDEVEVWYEGELPYVLVREDEEED